MMEMEGRVLSSRMVMRNTVSYTPRLCRKTMALRAPPVMGSMMREMTLPAMPNSAMREAKMP